MYRSMGDAFVTTAITVVATDRCTEVEKSLIIGKIHEG